MKGRPSLRPEFDCATEIEIQCVNDSWKICIDPSHSMIQHDPTKFQQDSTDDAQDWYFKCLHDSSSLCKKHGKVVMPDCFCMSLCYLLLVSNFCMFVLAACRSNGQTLWTCQRTQPRSQPTLVSVLSNWKTIISNLPTRAFLRENIRRIVFLLLRLGSRWVKQQFWHDQIVGEPCCNHPEPVCAKLLNHYKRLSGYPRRLAGEEESRAWPSPYNAVLAVEKLLRKQI